LNKTDVVVHWDREVWWGIKDGARAELRPFFEPVWLAFRVGVA